MAWPAIDRIRRAGRERRRYEDFQAGVEATVAPRLHRFAAAPLLLDDGTPPVAMAVCVDVGGSGDVAATRATLERQSVAPAAVVEAGGADCLTASTAPWLVLVRAGDRLAPRALEQLGRAAALAPDAGLITCDDDVLDRRGRRAEPRCAPGPAPDFMLAHDAGGAAMAIAPQRVGDGTAPALRGSSWRREVGLRLAGPSGAGHAHVPSILVHRAPGSHPPLAADGVLVRKLALEAWGEPGARVEASGRERYRVRRPLRGEPSVEAVVCFRDRPGLLRDCVRSVLGDTTYERLSLRLVDNGSEHPLVPELLGRFARDPRVTVDRDPRPFNFAALNNAAAARSRADFLIFLNNDVEVLTPAWVAELLEEAQRPEVGAVAPLLLYPDGRVQHVGAALGIHGYAGHPFAGLRPDERTPFGAATDGTRNWLAVSAACMMVEKRKFDAVGGFDESFAVGGNDVDLCLRLTAAGHRSLCVPHVTMRHRESASRDPRAVPAGDLERSRERYGAFRTVGDPFYNPNLTLAGTSCAMRAPGEGSPA